MLGRAARENSVIGSLQRQVSDGNICELHRASTPRIFARRHAHV